MIVKYNLSREELLKNNIGINDTSDSKYGEKWALISICCNKISTELKDGSLYIYIHDVDKEDIVLKIEDIDKYDLLWKCSLNIYMIYITPRVRDINRFMMDIVQDAYYADKGEHIYFKDKED